MKKIVLVILISLMILPAVNAEVLLRVGNLEITDKDIDTKLQQVPPNYKAAYSSEDGRKRLLEQLVQEKLIYIQARNEKYDTNAAVLKQLDQIKQSLMVRQYMADTLGKIKVTESELKTYFDENKEMFIKKEQVNAKHILCKTKEEAMAAKERILKGESFEDVAKEVSVGPSGKDGGDLGWFSKEQMVPEFANMAFSLEKEKISDPVKTQYGYHLIKVYDKNPPEAQTFSDARADLEKNLVGQKQKQVMDELFEKLKKENPVTDK